MTTYFPFTPTKNTVPPFSFQPTLDGALYSAQVTWNMMRGGWYLNLYDLNSNLILAEAVISSPDGYSIVSLAWKNGAVTLVTTTTHGFKLLSTVDLVVSGCAPAAYNGEWQMFVVDRYTLQFPLVADPGGATQLGTVIYDVNMVKSYFETSSLVFRESSQTFEVNP